MSRTPTWSTISSGWSRRRRPRSRRRTQPRKLPNKALLTATGYIGRMVRALVIVVTAGLLIGLAWPSGRETPAAVAVAQTGARKETVLERESNGHFYTHAKVNDRELIHFVVDTGATVVVLTVDDARRLGVPINPAEFTVV